MVMSVTGPGRATRAEWKLGVAPFAHMNPTKSPGEAVVVTWVVTNTGGASGNAQLRINDLLALVPLVIKDPMPIGPGESFILQAVWTVPSTGPSSYSLNTEVMDFDTGKQVAFHNFTVTVVAAGANLVVVGDPSIT